MTFDVAILGRTVWDDWEGQIGVSGRTRVTDCFGGPGANTAVLLAQLGLSCTFATCLGSDIRSSLYRERLESVGLDLSFAVIQASPLPACKITPGRGFSWFANDNGFSALGLIDYEAAVACSKAVIAVEYPLERIIGLGICSQTFISPQLALSLRTGESGLVAGFPWKVVYLNRKEARRVEKDLGRSIRELSRRWPLTTWITTDEAQPTRVNRGPHETSYAVPTVDCQLSIGGGDAFAAGYCAAKLKAWDDRRACGLGHRLAGAVVSQIGCQLEGAEVRELASSYGFYD